MANAPRALIAPPLSAPPRTGLLASVAPSTPMAPDGQPARWEGGYTFQPELCNGTGRASIACAGNTATLTPPTQPDAISGEPFLVWAADECSTFESAREQEARARRALNACLSSEIEAELWTGSLAKAATPDLPTPYLANPSSDVLSALAMAPMDALHCLEQGLAQCNCGQRGMIHATRQIVSEWAATGALRREGSVVLTINDTIVVPGAGYDGSDPDGNAAASGAIWAYATGPVQVHVSDVTIAVALDHLTNTRAVYAQQLAAAYFVPTCCHYAVRVDADLCGFAGAGS